MVVDSIKTLTLCQKYQISIPLTTNFDVNNGFRVSWFEESKNKFELRMNQSHPNINDFVPKCSDTDNPRPKIWDLDWKRPIYGTLISEWKVEGDIWKFEINDRRGHLSMSFSIKDAMDALTPVYDVLEKLLENHENDYDCCKVENCKVCSYFSCHKHSYEHFSYPECPACGLTNFKINQ